MKTHVEFRCAERFVETEEKTELGKGVLGTAGAGWFVAKLRRIDGLEIRGSVTQEEWGVIVSVKTHGNKFWIGLGRNGEHVWLAHVHHTPLAFWQRFGASGKRAFHQLSLALHQMLQSDRTVSEIRWFRSDDPHRLEASHSP